MASNVHRFAASAAVVVMAAPRSTERDAYATGARWGSARRRWCQVGTLAPVVDDWRVTVALVEAAEAEGLLGRLHGLQQGETEGWLEHEASRRLAGSRVVVSGGDSSHDGRLYLYADSRKVAAAATDVVRALLAERGVEAELALDRWHPLEERWEEASVPLPRTEEEQRVERERLEEQEEAESEASGLAEWEVRVELESHAAASELADRLEQEEQPVIRRWKYLLLGARDEDEAKALAERLGGEEPGAIVQVEPGGGPVWQTMPLNPFAIFGGLGT
jgi:hypothetical protein